MVCPELSVVVELKAVFCKVDMLEFRLDSELADPRPDEDWEGEEDLSFEPRKEDTVG